MNLEFKLLTFGSAEQLATIDLRYAVLRKPLGLVFSPQDLALEADQLHLAAYHQKELVACLLLLNYDSYKMKMRQVAVDNAWQGKGVGRFLVEVSEKIAFENDKNLMILHARETAVPFYLKLGYQIIGNQFEEVGIPHFKMEKSI